MSRSDDFQALRAGRGRGYLQAVQGGVLSVDDVMACVVDDPRWDRQVESRATYYAQMLVQMGANLTRVLRLRFLCEAYEEAPHSFARIRVMHAWSRMKTNRRVDALRWEALWDCEPASQELARDAGFSRERPPSF